MDTSVLEKIAEEVSSNPVVLYMKGTPDFPQCGFSYQVVEILNRLEVPFHAVDVLADDAVRAGIKTFGKWPTIPQLYVKGKLIGGCDIICQMDAADELEPMLVAVSSV